MSNVKLPDHRGRATMGSRVVPIGEFERALEGYGRAGDSEERAEARRRFLASPDDDTPVEGPYERIGVFGGVYSNRQALEALLSEARAARLDALYCLGDLGGFGPNPESIWPLLEQGDVRTIQGNYEQSLAAGADDCNCGYADPRDNHYAELSYRYTAERTGSEFRAYMGRLPARRRVRLGGCEWLLVHGSPRRVNEFLFASTTSTPFLERLLTQERADGLLCTHTGLAWERRLPSGRAVVNVGALGRPANDGSTDVRYAVLESRSDGWDAQVRSLRYDHASLIKEMRAEELPEPFIETIRSGWWTTCLEILPARERAESRL